MGQEEVLKVLEKEKKPLSVRELSIKMGRNSFLVSKYISRLLKYKEIKYKEIDRIVALSKYGCKRRMRVYYV